jgi:hypothetical protein
MPVRMFRLADSYQGFREKNTASIFTVGVSMFLRNTEVYLLVVTPCELKSYTPKFWSNPAESGGVLRAIKFCSKTSLEGEVNLPAC